MVASRQSHKSWKSRCFIIVVLLLVGYLARLVQAQEETQSETPTDNPTEVIVEATPVPAEVMPQADASEQPIIPVSSEPVILPTDLPPTEVEATVSPPSPIAPTDIPPTLLPSPTQEYTAEPSNVPVEPTEFAAVTPFPTTDIVTPALEVNTYRLSGQIRSLWPMGQATITIVGAETMQMMTTENNGMFAFNVPPDTYQLTVTAPHHLLFRAEFELGAGPFALPTILLIGGDIDGNGMLDRADAELIVQHFGQAVPPAPSYVDVNGDAVIDLYDLAIVSANLP